MNGGAGCGHPRLADAPEGRRCTGCHALIYDLRLIGLPARSQPRPPDGDEAAEAALPLRVPLPPADG